MTQDFERLSKERNPPKMRGWWFRQWCALRGHWGFMNYPGSSRFFIDEGLCVRCGDRVVHRQGRAHNQ